jgi:hypothetical protein
MVKHGHDTRPHLRNLCYLGIVERKEKGVLVQRFEKIRTNEGGRYAVKYFLYVANGPGNVRRAKCICLCLERIYICLQFLGVRVMVRIFLWT